MPNLPVYIGKLRWEGEVVGTAFLVHKRGLIATCYHVLKAAGENPVGKTFTFELLYNNQVLSAIVTNRLDPKLDIALLQINEQLPPKLEVATLFSSNGLQNGMTFEVSGFGKVDDPGHIYDYLSATGKIVGSMQRDGISVIQLESKQILKGMSGAPVSVKGITGVIGMVSGRYTPPEHEIWLEHMGWAAKSEDIANLDKSIELFDSTSSSKPRSQYQRYLSLTIKRFRIDYLRTLFAQHSKIKLTYFLGSIPKDTVYLSDVYVPLKYNVCFNLEVVNGNVCNWWLSPLQENILIESSDEGNDSNREILRQKTFEEFAPEEEAVSKFLLYISKKLVLEQNHGENNKLEDGIYQWRRLESEAGPALMNHIVLTGDPGSGKSTLLRHIAITMAGELLKEFGESSPINLDAFDFWPFLAYTPVFVELRALTRSAFPNLDDEVTVEKFLHFIEVEQLKPNGLNDLIKDLHNQMRDGGAILLLDGLDEVPNAVEPQRRVQIKTLLDLLSTKFPKCRIIVTSRPYAYAGDWHLDGFGHLTLAALDKDRLAELSRKLFKVVASDLKSDEESSDFIAYTEDLPPELLSNPLLFTLIAAIWINNRSQPGQRKLPISKASVYSECLETILRVWTHKDLGNESAFIDTLNLKRDDLPHILEGLAFRLQCNRKNDKSIESWKDGQLFESGLIMTVVRGLGIRGVNYDKLIETLAQRTGVIYEKSPDRFQFVHRTFQEYLAALHLLDKENFPLTTSECLKEDPGLWHEVAMILPEEAQKQSQSLWPLVRELLPNVNDPFPDNREDKTWQTVAYVGQLMHDHLPASDDLQFVYRPQLRRSLVALLNLGALSPIQRSEMGRILADLGDNRTGVGIQADGLPGIDWVDIPSGKFLFGPDNEVFDLPAFRISRYPVTYIQFQSFVNDKGGFDNPKWWEGLSESPSKLTEQHWRYDNNPREEINWYEAMAFCRWLSAKFGYEVRLPTEQEWEKAARGQEGLLYPYGKEFNSSKSNTSETQIGQTSAVGIFPDGTSPYGVLDMSGNVWQWCLTKWRVPSLNYMEANDPRGDYLRVVKGGSRSSTRQDSQTTASFSRNPHNRNNNLGIRLVCNNEIGIESLLKIPILSSTIEENVNKEEANKPIQIITKDRVVTSNRVITQNQGERLTTLSLNRNCSRLAFGGSSGRIFIISLGMINSKQFDRLPSHKEIVRIVKFHPLKEMIFSAADDGNIYLASPNENIYCTIGSHEGPIYTIAIHPDGNVMASAGRDGLVKLWDISPANFLEAKNIGQQKTYQPINFFDNSFGAVFSVDFNKDGNLLAAAYDDGIICIYNLENGRTQKLTGFAGAVLCVKFDSTGSLLVAAGQDRTVRLWDLNTGTQRIFEGHTDAARWVSFAPSGRFILSASKDQTLRLWDLNSDVCWVYKGHRDYLYCSEFNLDGSLIYSASGDGTIREWSCPKKV